jgi:hypothetical protein
MLRTRTIDTLALVVLLSPRCYAEPDLSSYRGFQFGMSLSAAVKQSGMDLSEVTTIHQRPARIQELAWNPDPSGGMDLVQQILLTFYNGLLFRTAVDYDTRKTEGLRVDDLVEALSARYGNAIRPAEETLLPSASFSGGVTVLARWEDADYVLNLVQSPYGLRFGVIASSKRLDTLAQAAIATGIHLDEQEAPRRQKLEEQNTQIRGRLPRVRVNRGLRSRPSCRSRGWRHGSD